MCLTVRKNHVHTLYVVLKVAKTNSYRLHSRGILFYFYDFLLSNPTAAWQGNKYISNSKIPPLALCGGGGGILCHCTL